MSLTTWRQSVLVGDEEGLDTAELLAVLLGSSEAAKSALASFESLGSLEEASVAELLALPGIGRRRASALRAAFALGRRRMAEPPWRGRPIHSSRDVYDTLHPLVRHERKEIVFVLALDSKNRLIRSPIVAAVGSLTHAALEPRDILRPLLEAAAASTILAHNHPSTCPEPSSEDISLSRAMFESCTLMGVRLLDHVVIGDGGWVSLADRGLL